jgi:hypothetical protein
MFVTLVTCVLYWVYKMLLLLSPEYFENPRPPHVLSRISRRFFVDIASTDIWCQEPHVKKKDYLKLFRIVFLYSKNIKRSVPR